MLESFINLISQFFIVKNRFNTLKQLFSLQFNLLFFLSNYYKKIAYLKTIKFFSLKKIYYSKKSIYCTEKYLILILQEL